jgi:hypothetical protein
MVTETQPDGPRESRRRLALQMLVAFALFQGLWLLVLGPWILPHLGDRVATRFGGEASLFVWSLRWWPHALGHLTNPLLSKEVWAPSGINLAWATTSPGPSVLMAPVTILAGPVVAFNLLSLVVPALNATSAYVLARYVTRSFSAALLGGFLFGLSPVVLREISQGHLNLSAVFLIPLAAYLILRRLDDRLGPRAFVALFTVVLVGQFSIFTEVVATMAVMAGLVGLVALSVAPSETRSRILQTGLLVAIAYALTAVVVSPYLYALVAYPDARKPGLFEGVALGAQRAGDLLLFINPGKGMLIGPSGGRGVANFWYLGLPLVVLLVLFWISRWRSWGVKVLAAGFLMAVVLSIGPHLPIGTAEVPMPWSLFAPLPLVGRARPGRLIVYALLFASISAAMWVAGLRWAVSTTWARLRVVGSWMLVVLAVVAFLPRLGSDIWTIPVPTVSFIHSGQYRQYLKPHEIVAVAGPYRGQQLFWQAETDFAFRLASWYQGFLPEDYRQIQTALQVRGGDVRIQDGPAILAYLRAHQVRVVIVGKGVKRSVVTRLASILGTPGERVGGITLFPVVGVG